MAMDRPGDPGCTKYLEYISAYLDDELGGQELVDLASHLKECAGCGRQVDELSAVKNILHQVEPFWTQVSPSGTFMTSVMGKVEEEAATIARTWEERRSGSFLARLTAGSSWMAAAAALVLVLGSLTLYFRDFRETPVSTLAEKETQPAAEIAMAGDPFVEYALEEYLQDHVMGSSQNVIMDYEDTVEFVGDNYP